MKKTSLDFLKRLMNAISPSGYELDAVRVFRKEAEAFAAEVRTDVHGNVDVVVTPGGSPRVMLGAEARPGGSVTECTSMRPGRWPGPSASRGPAAGRR